MVNHIKLNLVLERIKMKISNKIVYYAIKGKKIPDREFVYVNTIMGKIKVWL